jgi:hypothetical protein
VFSCLLVAAFPLAVNVLQFGFRYLLPLNAFLILAASMEFNARLDGKWKHAALGLLATLVLASAGSFLEMARVPSVIAMEPAQRVRTPDDKAVESLIRKLKDAGIRDVYCFHSMFSWNIIFASRDTIRARWMEPADRRSEYSLSVDLALLSGKKVAVVGQIGILPELKKFLAKQGYGRPDIWVVEDAFFILPNPPPQLVAQLGFRLNDLKRLEAFSKTRERE